MSKHFLNLTNGLDDLPIYLSQAHFIRIQSTICEAKNWNRLIADLDNNFLMSLALGDECIIHDYSSKKSIPRSLYQGLEFIKFVLCKRWFGVNTKAYVKRNDCTKYFEQEEHNLDRWVKHKIDYYKKFIQVNEITLKIVTGSTAYDGDYEHYNDVCNKYYKRNKE